MKSLFFQIWAAPKYRESCWQLSLRKEKVFQCPKRKTTGLNPKENRTRNSRSGTGNENPPQGVLLSDWNCDWIGTRLFQCGQFSENCPSDSATSFFGENDKLCPWQRCAFFLEEKLRACFRFSKTGNFRGNLALS